MDYIAHNGALHEYPECPEDDTCDCKFRDTNASVTVCCKFLHDAPPLIDLLTRENADLRAESESRRKAWCVLRSALNAIAWTTYDNVAFAMRTAQDALAIGCPVANGRSDKAATDALTAELADLRARLAAAEKARDEQAEAVRKLGFELQGWRCGGIRFMDGASGYGARSIGIQVLRYFDACRDVDNNPTAAAAVKEASK